MSTLRTSNLIHGSSAVSNVVLDTQGRASFGPDGPNGRAALYVNPQNNRVGVNNESPSTTLDVDGAINTTGDLTVGGTLNLTGAFTSDVINAGSGTAAAPSVSVGTTDNGLYSPGTDEIGVSTNGVQRLAIDSSGRLLVGTSTAPTTGNQAPYAKISSFGNTFDNNAAGYINIGRNETAANMSSGNGVGGLIFADSAGGQFAQIDCFADGTPGTNDYPGRLTFSTTADGASSSTERLRIDSSGNVGIGRTSPAQNLDVASSNNIAYALDGWALAGKGDSSDILFGGILGSQFDTLKFFTSGSERMRIDSSGNVGIGTTSPGAKLEVSTTGANATVAVNRTDASTAGNISLNAGNSANYINNSGTKDFTINTSNLERLRIDSSGNVGIGTTSPGARLNIDGDFWIDAAGATRLKVTHTGGGDMRIDNPTSTLAFATGSTERMRIDTSGNVGIGTTSPAPAIGNGATLHLYGATTTPELRLARGNGTDVSITAGSTAGGCAIQSSEFIAFRPNSTERARIDSSGRLLVGTSSSSGADATVQSIGTFPAQFHRGADVTGGPNVVLSKSRNTAYGSNTIVQDGDTLGTIQFRGDDGTDYQSTGAYIQAFVDGTPGANDMPGRLVFSTTADGAASPTERMRIKNNGDIWLNSSNGSSGTQGIVANVNGLLTVCTTNITAQVVNVNSGSGTRTLIQFRTDGTNRGSITSNGSTVAYNTSSDYRLKENVVPLTGAADRVNQLQVHRFNFIADPDTTIDGFLAHEAQAVVPECVTGEKDAVDDEGNPVYQGIDQSKLVPMLTAALQEALAKIETQAGVITALDARLKVLESN
jgi:hypothetical protein